MAIKSITFKPDDDDQPPWTHWNQSPDGEGWRANFYNTTKPYMRHPRQVTGIGPNLRSRLEEMKAEVDAKAAAEGLVTFDKLPEEIQLYWAEADAAWLIADITRHVAE